jgi:putative endonuclease
MSRGHGDLIDFRQDDGYELDMAREPFVYILASRRHGTIYIGVTSDLPGRLYKHRTGMTGGFASRYAVYRLVHYEPFAEMDAAIAREKQLKAWRRAWKIALIEESNPFWEDRAVELGFEPLVPHPATKSHDPSSRT